MAVPQGLPEGVGLSLRAWGGRGQTPRFSTGPKVLHRGARGQERPAARTQRGRHPWKGTGGPGVRGTGQLASLRAQACATWLLRGLSADSGATGNGALGRHSRTRGGRGTCAPPRTGQRGGWRVSEQRGAGSWGGGSVRGHVTRRKPN